MPHIVTAFGNQLQALKDASNDMAALVRSQYDAALTCFEMRDAGAAERVVMADERIDALQRQIDEDVIRMLALRQPMGGDLRRTVTALKIAADLERMGDYAANIAKRTIALTRVEPFEPVERLGRMGQLVRTILEDVAEAHAVRDAELAVNAWKRDCEVDALHTAAFAEIVEKMIARPSSCPAGAHLLFIAKNIERIGDHATNIAENVHFLITGRTMRTQRPKEDEASFAVIAV